MTLGTLTDEPGPTSDYTGRQSTTGPSSSAATDRLTIHDYLWRWDTDWFWCSRAFGAQHPVVRRLWPKRLLRSSFYWKLVALDRRFDIADRLERLHHRPPLERVVQDIEVPVGRTAEFVTGSWTRPDRTDLALPAAPAGESARDGRPDLAAVSDRPGADLRQRRILVGGPATPRASRTAPPIG